MDIKDFFDLPHEQRELLVEMHRKQKRIRNDRDVINAEIQRLETRRFNMQQDCDHPFADKKYKAHENEFGNLTGGGTYYHHCDDCGLRWTTNK